MGMWGLFTKTTANDGGAVSEGIEGAKDVFLLRNRLLLLTEREIISGKESRKARRDADSVHL